MNAAMQYPPSSRMSPSCRSPLFGCQVKQRPIIVAGEVGIEPGVKVGMVELVRIDTGQDGGADQDFAAGVFFAGAVRGEDACPGFDALLPDFKLLEFGFEVTDAVGEFGHVGSVEWGRVLRVLSRSVAR